MLKHNFSERTLPSRVLILGGSGFLGQAVGRLCRERAIPVSAPARGDIDLLNNSSVRQLKDLVGSTDVLILAAGLTPDRGRDASTMLMNLEMANNLASLLRTIRCGHLICVSSDAVYRTGSGPLDENSRCDSAELYGMMHYMREQILATAASAISCPYLVLRPCAVYGFGDTHNSYGPNRFVRTGLQDGEIILIGHGEERRDHVCISDFAQLVLECVLHKTQGVLNVATGRAISFQAVAQLVQSQLSSRVTIRSKERTSPVTHRHFDITNRIRAFPRLAFSPPEVGIMRMLAEHSAATTH